MLLENSRESNIQYDSIMANRDFHLTAKTSKCRVDQTYVVLV